MPKENNNYYKTSKYDGLKRINYYIKVDDKCEKFYTTHWPATATTITESDFIEIEGYEVNKKDSSGVNTFLDFGDKNNIYYDPKEYNLVLASYLDVTKTFKVIYGKKWLIHHHICQPQNMTMKNLMDGI